MLHKNPKIHHLYKSLLPRLVQYHTVNFDKGNDLLEPQLHLLPDCFFIQSRVRLELCPYYQSESLWNLFILPQHFLPHLRLLHLLPRPRYPIKPIRLVKLSHVRVKHLIKFHLRLVQTQHENPTLHQPPTVIFMHLLPVIPLTLTSQFVQLS